VAVDYRTTRVLNSRGFERVSNKYGKIEKLVLVMCRELWRGSSGERDVGESYLFKYILVLLFFATLLINLFAVSCGLSSLWRWSRGPGRCAGSGAVLQQSLAVEMAVAAQLVLCC